MNQVLTPNNVETFGGLKIIKDDVIVPGLFMGIYGTGGGGKTTLVADIVRSPYGTPALLVDAEGGSSSVTHLREYGLDIVQPTSWAQILKIKQEFERGDHKYKSLIFDNISEMLSLIVKSKAPTGMPEGNMALKIWGQVTAEMQEFVRELRASTFKGRNVLMVLWEENPKEESTGIIHKRVNLTPKLAAAFPGMVTMLGNITVPGNEKNGYIRKLSFAPSEKTDSKFRVAPTDVAAKIPLELWLNNEVHFLVDFLATVRDGKPFPTQIYEKPKKE